MAIIATYSKLKEDLKNIEIKGKKRIDTDSKQENKN